MNASETARRFKLAKSVDGWFQKEAALLLALFDEVQKRADIRGDLFEIGVHHGRSSAVLSHFTRSPDERYGVCDLFGEQGANVSDSGRGDRAIFESNMAKLGPDGLRLEVFAKRSDQLSLDEIGRNAYRFFHVDGGHNPDEALADLELASEAIAEAGIIVVDDPFKVEWPGVAQASVEFLLAHPEFDAVAAGFNKLILARRDSAEPYRAAFADPDTVAAAGLGPPVIMLRRRFVNAEPAIFTYRGGDLMRAARSMSGKMSWLRRIVPRSVRKSIKRRLH